MAPGLIHYVQPVGYRFADGLVAQVYDEMLRDFELVPPITVHSPLPEVLAGVWAMVRESMLAGPVSRTEREAGAGAVSLINKCPFCVDVHGTMLHAGSEHDVAKALLTGRTQGIEASGGHGSRIHAITQWALATRTPEAEIIRDPPFSRDEAPEFIGTAVAFHYINRMANVFLGESPTATVMMTTFSSRRFAPAFPESANEPYISVNCPGRSMCPRRRSDRSRMKPLCRTCTPPARYHLRR